MNVGIRLPADLRLELVVLDRDGVLNRDLDRGVRRNADWAWLPGARAAVNLLFDHGLRLMVATNQANIGRGIITTEQLTAIHERMVDELRPAQVGLADILYCPHPPESGCCCRKPEPGLVHAAMRAGGVGAERTLLWPRVVGEWAGGQVVRRPRLAEVAEADRLVSRSAAAARTLGDEESAEGQGVELGGEEGPRS